VLNTFILGPALGNPASVAGHFINHLDQRVFIHVSESKRDIEVLSRININLDPEINHRFKNGHENNPVVCIAISNKSFYCF
jgi:hypothetical protein